MLIRCLFVAFFCSITTGLPGAAQDDAATTLDVDTSAVDYLRAIRFRGIDSDVRYFDPTRPAPELSTTQQPDGLRDEDTRVTIDGDPTRARNATALVAAMIFAGLLYVVFLNVRGSAISFGSSPQNLARQKGRARAGGWQPEKTSASLAQILRLGDRREALVALSRYALSQVIAAQGIVAQRSWTARDALRRVPQDLDQHAELTELVLTSERVQFGGRDVSEDDFQRLLEQVRPLLNMQAASPS